MPAKTKRKPKKSTTTKKPAKKTSTRYADAYCKGECRIRTKGMRIGDRRRRVSSDGKKLVIIRVP